MKKPRIFKCNKCGQIVIKIIDKDIDIICCGQPMEEVVPGTVDAALEKHVPVVTFNGNNVLVEVGEVEHPSIPEHYIQEIGIFTKDGMARKALKPGDKPAAEFALHEGDEFVEAFAHCNIHGVWESNNQNKLMKKLAC